MLRRVYGVRSRLFPLRLRETTTDPARFELLLAEVDDALEHRGLAEGGRLLPPVATAFELLAGHRVAVSVSGVDKLAVLAVSDGTRAMTIAQAPDGELSFALFPDDELAGAMVALLPQVRAAAGTPVVVGRTGDAGVFGDPASAGRLAEELAGRVGHGLMVASGEGRRGRRTDMLGWVDTAEGRYLVHTATDRSGNFAAGYEPAGPAELTAAVTELLAVAGE